MGPQNYLFYFFSQRKWSSSKKYIIELARSFGADWLSPTSSRVIKGVFVWGWNMVDGKLWKKNGKKNFLEYVWLDGEGGK